MSKVKYFECLCGLRRPVPLTDTVCGRCKDIYIEEWYSMPDGRGKIRQERGKYYVEYGPQTHWTKQAKKDAKIYKERPNGE